MLKFLALIGLLGILAGIGTAVFFLGGFYSVATTAEEPGIVHWALVQVRMASISRHATDAPPDTLESRATLRSGARAFSEHGCPSCHGGPGVEWAKFSEGLRPDPPDLKEVVNERTPAQLFWVIKNGINMTGMPGFGEMPDPEIWSIVAFLKKLPTVSDEDFKAWSASESRAPNL
jgi:Cytochrome C oxidase, cbb3-type, subunit III